MLKFPCLVLDHDNTVVQTETSINYPCFCHTLNLLRPGMKISLQEYLSGCFSLGFPEMCRQWYHFTEEEMAFEHAGWRAYHREHLPATFSGINRIIRRQKENSGLICVVSDSSLEFISRDYLAHFGITPDAIYSWDYPPHQRKPNSFPLEDIQKRFGLSSSELLVIDDMPSGCSMAHNASVASAFAAWGYTAYPNISVRMQAMCDYAFETPEALEHFLFD